ncbi:MarR family winged helix-turn-helix transcriptional regulator [Pectinatus frisingensis]|jgi:DNA-binding MarR family transcriptional regulator|uniref:MarR family winged helix-turn-helix transcriptional regulator n=1 Tax=Pectinatus frisingensis TaxID=865 RepID=UPI0015F4FFC9|nr:MarR family transcriptional regulator [Pectinatus frisingensis]
MNNTYELSIALHRLGRQLHRAYHRGNHHNGHYREQSHLLFLIAENDGIIQRDLAEKMDVRPSSMTEMVTKMETAGLIIRQQDKKDQRIMHLFLTEQGKESIVKSREKDIKLTDNFFQGLTEEEVGEMLRLTEKLCAYLESTTEMEPDICMHRSHGGFGQRMRRMMGHHHRDE